MMKRRLLVLSVDAMVREDVEYLKTLPNYSKYLAGCSEVKTIRTIYPSVTYPAHVSMATGCYPAKTGVYSNYAFTLGSKEETWNWFHDAVKVEDIFTAAKRGGYSTAALFWPVTGCHPDIDYLMNEYWMPNPNDTLESSFRRAGSGDEMIKIILKNEPLLPASHVKTGRINMMKWPEADNFLFACACDLIRQHKPEVLFVHNGSIDHARHQYGIFNDKINENLRLVDAWIGQMMEALDDAGVLGDTNIVITSDHGQMDLSRIIKPNVFLADNGFITLSPDGKITDYTAYCFSNAMSTMVFLKDPSDRAACDAVYSRLAAMAEEGIYGFTKVFTREELREREQLDGDFSFVLETDGYTSFSDSCVRPVINNTDLTDFRFGRATHGYLPDLGPQPVFVGKGPAFKRGVTLERRNIVDEAPTYAALLGVDLPQADGTPIAEMLA